MTQVFVVRPWCLGVTLPLILAAALHQGFATVAPTPAGPTTAPPHKDPERPERGTYSVKNSNGTVCLMANMGIQLNISYSSVSQKKTVQEIMNLKPNLTSNGSCESNTASLWLLMEAEKTNLTFVFSLNTTSRKYHLSDVSLTASWPDMKEPFSAQNSSLDYMRGTLGLSYMCREEQTLDVTPALSINTFQVQLQPFGVEGSQFGAAEECQLDEDDMLIPIIVGAALAGLVLIVLLAYLIGRKRSHAGYQTI